MAEAAKRTSATTTLVIGAVKVPVGLFTTVEKPGKLQEFTTAGPNGGRLLTRAAARPVAENYGDQEHYEEEPSERADPLAVDETAQGTGSAEVLAAPVPDPLGPDPGMGRDTFEDAPAGSPVAGEYGQVLVEEGTGEVVPPGDVRHGVRLEDGRFVDCTRVLAAIEARTRIEQATVVGFVDITHVPRARVKGSYYVGAGDAKAPRALRIMFEGLRRKRRAALVKLTKRSRQTFGVIAAVGETLVMFELVWAEDFRPAPARARQIQAEVVNDHEVAMFCDLIDAMAVPPSAVDDLRDDAIALREELRARALAGGVVEDVIDAEVIDTADELADQLAASLAGVR